LAKEFQMAFAIGAKLQGQFGSAFKSAQSSVVTLQNKIESLNRKQGDISAYQKQQQAVEQTRSKLETLQKQYENLRSEMGQNGEASTSLKNAMLQKELQIERTTASLEGQEKKLGSMGGALSDAGVNTDSLAQESKALAAELDNLKGQQEEIAAASQNMGQSMGEAASSMEQMLAAVGVTAALKAGYDLMRECTQASIEFETGMAGVQRTVGGSQQFLDSLGESFKEMGTVIPITNEALTGIATTAGQLGIAQKDVESFTTVMAKLDTTTDLTAESAATMLAQFSNITGVTQYDRLGAVVADLGDATATTASKVVEMSQGMASAAHLAGMGATDILGISAAVGSLGVEAQAGSTAMSTLISTLHKAVETGDGLNDFASVANMTAEQFKTAWAENAAGALNTFIQGLNDTERNGRSAIVILDDLGITNVRQTKAILGLASAGNLLNSTITQANAAWQQNTALNEKAAVMYGTTQSKLTMAQNAANNLKIAIGDALTPAIGAGAAAFTSLIQPIAQFIQRHPALVKAVTAAAGVIGAATLAVTGYAAAAKIAAAASALFASTILGLNIIMGVTVGIAALTAGIVWLSDAVKDTQETMEDLDAEFTDLNVEFRRQGNIKALCEEYKQLQGELFNTKNGFTGLANQDDITVTITAQALATLIPEDFMNPDAEGIMLTAGQVADLVASGFMLEDDDGILLTAKQTADLVASGFLKPDDEGITLTAKQTADLIASGFLNPEDKGITLTAKQTADLLSSGFMSPDDEAIFLEAQQVADKLSGGFMAEDDPGITLSAAQTAELVSAGFMKADDKGITLTAQQTADLVSTGFLKADDPGITLKATQTSDLIAAGFMIDPNEKIPISGSAIKELEAKGFLKGTDTIEIKGKADEKYKITVDDYIAASDRVVELTANVSNLAEVQQAISALQTEAEGLKDKAASAKSDLTDAQAQLADMQTRQSQLEARLTHANTDADKSAIQAAIEAQTEAIAAQETKVGELESAYATAATQYALTQAAAEELTQKEQRLAEVKAELSEETNGVVSAIEKETAAINAQVEQAERMAASEQARLRGEIYANVNKQAATYARTVKESGEVMAGTSRSYDIYNRTLKYAGMNAEQVNAAYQELLETFDQQAQGPGFDVDSADTREALADIQALATLMGATYSNIAQYGDGSKSLAEAFGFKTNDYTLNAMIKDLSDNVADYGEAAKEAEAAQRAFIENLGDGVKSGAITAEEAMKLLNTSLTGAGMTAEQVQEAVALLNTELGETPEAVADSAASAAEVTAAIQPVLDKMNALGEAYTAAYDAAYKSMDGQFKLFEEAPELTKQSVDQMIKSLESQAEYMQEYTWNLQEAGRMGLADGLLAQLSDGSAESAAYLAAIVSDGANKIDELNIAFADVEKGKEKFAGTVAEMQTGFDEDMANLQKTLEETIAEMDMSADAAKAGADTVQSFADAARGKTGAVTSAFSAVAQAAIKALMIAGKIPGYAAGTENAERGFKMVGENGPEMVFFNGGEKVLNAQETTAFQREHALEAEPMGTMGAGGGSGPHIEIKPVYNLSGNMDSDQIRAILDAHTEELREMVRETMDELESDKERMVYS